MRDDMKDRLEQKDQQSATADWTKLTVFQLREELKRRGLPVSGRKAELVERLVFYEETDGESDGRRSGRSDGESDGESDGGSVGGSDSESDAESASEDDDMEWKH
jgi:SAP domain-containing ribonucleoprotein